MSIVMDAGSEWVKG